MGKDHSFAIMSSPEAHRVCSSRSWKNRIPLHRPATYENFPEGTSVYLFTITKEHDVPASRVSEFE